MILPLVGQALPDPNHFASLGWTLASLAALVVIVRNAMGLWRDLVTPTGAQAMTHATTHFQPRGDYVTRDEFDSKLNSVRGDIARLTTYLHEMDAESNKRSEERISKVHERIDDLPAQIVAMLKNTGAI
jgi:hypothetical protein